MKVLIVGAGPTGLTAALELCRQGLIPTVIDRKPSASKLSRAVGITPKSLQLWSQVGVDKEIIKRGTAFKSGRVFLNKRQALELPFNSPDSYFHTLVGLPQDQTESILVEALRDYSCHVRYDCEFVGMEQDSGSTKVYLQKSGNQEDRIKEEAVYDLVIGADGVHSQVRQAAGIDYIGYDLPETWSIADIDSSSWSYQDDFCLFRLDNGDLAVVVPIGHHRYRIISNTENALEAIPVTLDIDNIHREGTFNISIRQAETYSKGDVHLAGDAAHCHSPVGGRGMNLGIADAVDLARRIVNGDLDNYSKVRAEQGKEVIEITERARRMIAAKSKLKRSVFRLMLIFAKIPLIKKRIARFAVEF